MPGSIEGHVAGVQAMQSPHEDAFAGVNGGAENRGLDTLVRAVVQAQAHGIARVHERRGLTGRGQQFDALENED